MLQAKEDLIQVIENRLLRMAVDIKSQNKIIEYCHKKYKVDQSVISDYLRGQKSLLGITPHLLFILADGLDLGKNKLINQFYTSAEKEVWSNEISKESKVEFPLRFKMVQIADDSWIGPINVRELSLLYKNQLINYNENTQRALKMSFYKGEGVYRIVVNRKAVQQIKECFQENKYIPNTITLNIADDDNADYYYNKEGCELVIKKIRMFDILDGYHRLLAISQIVGENPDFNYPMELRITNYGIEKAKMFIYQEDQKTKMKKIDSDSYNVYSLENKVINKINIDPKSDVQGMIGAKGNIDPGQLGALINFFWFKGVPKEEGKRIVFVAADALTKAFNELINNDNSYLTKKYSFKELLSICYYANKISDGLKVSGKQIQNLILKLEKDEDVRIKNNQISKPVVNYITKLVEGV